MAPSPILSPFYLMAEAARFRGYTEREWAEEDNISKARVVAHFMEHNIRENYAYEKAEERAEKGSNGRGHGSSPPPNFFQHRQGR